MGRSENLVIAGGRVVDPSQALEARLDVRLRDGVVVEVGESLDVSDDERRIDASSLVVAPGLVDVHVHFREPGGEHKETIESGSRAAAAGGFTSVCAMPNTTPVNDTPAVTLRMIERAREVGLVNLFPIGAITKGSKGEELAAIGGLARAGCVAISDDGQPVMNAHLLRRAMEYAAEIGLPLVDHCEDKNLSAGGSINEGCCSARLGVGGINRVAEEVHVARDCLLAEITGAHVHIAHVSTARALDFIRDAKARGLRVTCEVTPHHYTLTEEAVGEFETNAKMNPPLRAERDREALLEAIADGTIDCIATDHAPHHADEKALTLDAAPFGIVGLETSLALGLTNLVETGRISLTRLVDLMSTAPARIFALGRGTLAVGAPADVVCFVQTAEVTVEAAGFRSKSRNSPFIGLALRGRVVATILGGRVTHRADETIGAAAP
jgi:dihydroorotase